MTCSAFQILGGACKIFAPKSTFFESYSCLDVEIAPILSGGSVEEDVFLWEATMAGSADFVYRHTAVDVPSANKTTRNYTIEAFNAIERGTCAR